MKTTILALILAGAFGALTVIQRNTSHQLREARAVVQQQANEIASLRPATQQLLKQTDELEQLRRLAQDVPGLRGQIAQLRREKADQKTVTAQTAEGQTNTPPNPEESPIVITAKFVSVPTEPLKAFGWSQAIARPGGIVYMADAEVRSASQDLATVEGMDLLNSPRVTTANGNAADLFAGETVPLGGTNAPIGVSLHVNPHFSTNSFNSPSITLEFAAKLNQLIEVSTQQGSFERGLRATTITNSISVLDGQTVVLREDIPEGDRVVGSTNLVAGPKSLLLFLTTQLVRDGYTQRLERVVHKD
jgi:hypothetical protein